LLWQIKDAGGPPLEDLQEIIGQTLGKRGGDSIAKWRRGQPVARQQDVEGLVQALAAWAQEVELPRESFRLDLHTLLTLADHPHPVAVLPALAQPASQSPRPAKPAGRTDWGRSPDVAGFVGRESELAQLRHVLQTDHSRLVGIFGLGGVGKTFLTKKAALDAAPAFDATLWVLLQDGPPLDEVLSDCIHFFSDYRDTALPATTAGRIDRLLTSFRTQRCLLIFDKLEAVMRPGGPAGHFRDDYAAYGDLIQAVAETEHQGCLVLVSREKPRDMARWEGASRRVTTLPLKGISAATAKAILEDSHLAGSHADWEALVLHYAGNPLMLKLAAAPIRDLYAGQLADFLTSQRFAFEDVNDLLDEHFDRLSASEQDVMYWLALERTSLSPDYLAEYLLPRQPINDVWTTLSSLLRRHLVDKGQAGFFLQDIVLEYVTNRLVQTLGEEIIQGRADHFRRFPLLNATAREYKRLGQERFIAAPLAESLRQVWPQRGMARRLVNLVTIERGTGLPGYTAGNSLNLLRHIGDDLTSADFSQVSVWRAFLQGVDLHAVNLAGADLRETVFTEAFSSVAALGLSPDGALLAAGADSGDIYLWRCRDFKRLLTLKGHSDWVRS
ncbi:MAG: pentapeptide repeat-containing protein, partial [Anaerolineae bacterium]